MHCLNPDALNREKLIGTTNRSHASAVNPGVTATEYVTSRKYGNAFRVLTLHMRGTHQLPLPPTHFPPTHHPTRLITHSIIPRLLVCLLRELLLRLLTRSMQLPPITTSQVRTHQPPFVF